MLSGGEKSRLALAKLLLKQCNLLILDEPTNHLDISAKKMLKDALIRYNGTLIVVSHDREFLQGLTDRTFEFKNGGIKEHSGTIDDFLSNYQVESFRQFEGGPKQEKVKVEKKVSETSNSKISNQVRKEKEKERRRLQKSVSNLEKKIETQESEIQTMENRLTDPEISKTDPNIFFEHAELQKKLEEYMARWEKASEELSAVEKELKN